MTRNGKKELQIQWGGVVVNGTKHNFLDNEKGMMTMTDLVSIWADRVPLSSAHEREGGGR